jgi:hypothetical protein
LTRVNHGFFVAKKFEYDISKVIMDYRKQLNRQKSFVCVCVKREREREREIGQVDKKIR